MSSARRRNEPAEASVAISDSAGVLDSAMIPEVSREGTVPVKAAMVHSTARVNPV